MKRKVIVFLVLFLIIIAGVSYASEPREKVLLSRKTNWI